MNRTITELALLVASSHQLLYVIYRLTKSRPTSRFQKFLLGVIFLGISLSIAYEYKVSLTLYRTEGTPEIEDGILKSNIKLRHLADNTIRLMSIFAAIILVRSLYGHIEDERDDYRLAVSVLAVYGFVRTVFVVSLATGLIKSVLHRDTVVHIFFVAESLLLGGVFLGILAKAFSVTKIYEKTVRPENFHVADGLRDVIKISGGFMLLKIFHFLMGFSRLILWIMPDKKAFEIIRDFCNIGEVVYHWGTLREAVHTMFMDAGIEQKVRPEPEEAGGLLGRVTRFFKFDFSKRRPGVAGGLNA